MNTILKYSKEINKNTLILIVGKCNIICTRKDSEILSYLLSKYHRYKLEYIEKKLSEKNINYIILDKQYEYRTLSKNVHDNNKYKYYGKIVIKIKKLKKIKNAMIKNNNLINIIERMIFNCEKIL